MKRTSRERIESVLIRAPRRGIDAETIAVRSGVPLATTRTILTALQVEGYMSVLGRRSSGRGRPANLYGFPE